MKKAQMEIMGLAIIVVLLTLGVLFIIQFVVIDEHSDVKKTFTRTQMAANMLNSILKTTAKDCYGATINHLLKDCADFKENPSGLRKCENNMNSCDYLNSTMDYMFNHTFIEWGNQSFYFKSSVGNDLILEQGTECTGERESEQSPVRTNTGILIISLDVCG